MIEERALGYAFFARKVGQVIGVDLALYRAEHMERRLRYFLARFAGETFFTLGRRLERDETFAEQVRDFLTVNVSEFFRNPERFRQLEDEILPLLAARGSGLNVWSAGCSIGAEPYSLAISLLATDRAQGAAVWATDIDPQALRRAQAGVYRPAELRAVDPARLRRFFAPAGDGYAVRPAVKALVRFEPRDLLRGSFPDGWDLIVCRNVVIYFTEQARAELYARFARALRPGGVLFVGGTESILRPAALGLTAAAPFFYRKTGR